MSGRGSGEPGSRGSYRPVHRRAIDAERLPSDADQGAADADQTASDADQGAADADQTASERDDADAASDQRASEQDQASADRLRPTSADGAALEAFEAARSIRQASTAHRLATHVARATTADSRAETAAARDATAAERDATARERDLRAQAIERSIAASNAPLAAKLEQLRAIAAADRARAAADRARAAQDRAYGARERARLEAELGDAHFDELTGAFRREMGTLALALDIDRARRGDGRFVIALVDVDALQRINDRDGRAAGDRVLRTLVATLRANLRPFDPIARYGGDEFVCGLGGADLDDVVPRFELIAGSLAKDLGIEISVGLAALAAEETLDELTQRAHAALLVAKEAHGL